MDDHENVAIAAVIEIIKRRTARSYWIECRPDEKNRNSKDIDFILSSEQGPNLAVEHTTVESFDNQRGFGQLVVQFVGRIEEQFRPFLLPDTYHYLTIPTDFVPRTTKSEQQRAISQIVTWMQNVMHELEPHGKRVSLDLMDGQFRVWFGRGGNHVKLNGRLHPRQMAPPNLEEQRPIRLKRALSDKLPKLLKYKTVGYETLLVLDDVDMALSNNVLVEETITDLCSRHSFDPPDHIYQLTSFGDEIVEGWIIKERDSWGRRIQNPGPFYEFSDS